MFSYRIRSVLGIPVDAHLTLLLVLPWLAAVLYARVGLNLLFSAITLAAFFASIALHEAAHAVVAMRQGYGVRRILLLPFGGITQLSHAPSPPRAEALIAVAGPAVNLGVAIGALPAAWLLAAVGGGAAALVVYVAAVINLGLALINLLPSFPLDGGRLLRAWLTSRWGQRRATLFVARIGRWTAVACGVLGLMRFNLLWLVIAIFLFQAAGRELRRDVIKTRFPFLDPEPGDDVVVGPPPYARFQSLRTARPLRRSQGPPVEDHEV